MNSANGRLFSLGLNEIILQYAACHNHLTTSSSFGKTQCNRYKNDNPWIFNEKHELMVSWDYPLHHNFLSIF